MLFNNNVHEITSISLEHDLKEKENNLVSGNFYISGEYKVSDTSTNTETFNFTLPCDINLDNKYILKNLKIDIDDFYYEVINSNILKVNIDVLLDNLEEKEEIKEVIVEENRVEEENMEEREEVQIKSTPIQELKNDLERESDDKMEIEEKERCIEDEDISSVNSIFGNFSEQKESYKTYKVYIVREGDSIDTILQKYSVSREILEKYNNLNEINLGDKIIIPSTINEKD
mgnify:FL=1